MKPPALPSWSRRELVLFGLLVVVVFWLPFAVALLALVRWLG